MRAASFVNHQMLCKMPLLKKQCSRLANPMHAYWITKPGRMLCHMLDRRVIFHHYATYCVFWVIDAYQIPWNIYHICGVVHHYECANGCSIPALRRKQLDNAHIHTVAYRGGYEYNEHLTEQNNNIFLFNKKTYDLLDHDHWKLFHKFCMNVRQYVRQ